MASRLLRQLDAALATEADPVRGACLRARRALQWARLGRHAEARDELAAIREAFGAAPQAEVTAWVNLAEAVSGAYDHPGPQAQDRLERALLLARAIGHAELQALCAAWLAHLDFNASRFQPMVGHAAQALQLAAPEHHAVHARVCLVVADAHHYADCFEQARPWYEAARRHALVDGDHATVSAILHNLTIFRVNNVRMAAVFGGVDAQRAALALLEAESARHYEAGIGITELGPFQPLPQAQLLTVIGRWEQALALFRQHVELAAAHGMERMLLPCLADMAWCWLQLGRADDAQATLARAQAQPLDGVEPDDLACAHLRFAQLHAAAGDAAQAAACRARADAELGRYRALQRELLALLARGLPATPPVP